MGKICALSALALMTSFTIPVINIDNCSAQENIIYATTEKEDQLAEVVRQAKLARDLAKQHPSAKYPGIAKYIDKLIQTAEAENIEDIDALIAALDDAVYATPLLIENSTNQAVQDHSHTTTSSQNIPTTTNTTIAVTVDSDKQNSTQNPVEQEQNSEEVIAKTEPEVVELPNTGEIHQAGFGELFIAGSIIVVGTLGATLLIVRKR